MKPMSMLLCLTLMGMYVRVWTACHAYCSACVDGSTCERCMEGRFLDTNDCNRCPGKCTSCNSTEYCYGCAEGYYGTTCLNKCSNTCPIKECDKESGECAPFCNEGYFESESICHHCEANCKTCANFSTACLVCKEGFYGPSCQYNCSHCKNRLCSKDNCTDGCRDGYYLTPTTCNPCNINCQTCNGSSMNCHTCKVGYHGSSCQYCTKGYYLDSGVCKPCYTNCATCSTSATDCRTCETGHYGPSCQHDCSHCKDSICSKDSCTDGCREGYFQNTTTTECHPCSTNCTSCSGILVCHTCHNGYYGSSCQYSCQNCIACTKENGTCIPIMSTSTGTTPTAGANTAGKPGHVTDDNIGLYAGVGGGALLVILIIIVIVLVIRKRRSPPSTARATFDADNISMTENERYISADDCILARSDIAENGSGASRDTKENGPHAVRGCEENDNLYAMPNKTGNTSNVATETKSATAANSGQQNDHLPFPTQPGEVIQNASAEDQHYESQE